MELIERSKIRLVLSTYWLKVGPCPSECVRKDLMHVIGSTFGGVIRFETKGDFCQIKVLLDVWMPFHRGIFVLTNSQQTCWVPFKYEKLSRFCFNCGRLGHKLKDYYEVSVKIKELPKDENPFSVALRVESNLVGKVSLALGLASIKMMA